MRLTVVQHESSPTLAWIVADDAGPCGCLHGRRPRADLFVIDNVGASPATDPTTVARVLATTLAAVLPDERAEVLVVEREELAPLRSALEEAGLRVRRRKLAVARELGSWLPQPLPASFVMRTLAEVGEPAFVARMALASKGDPFEDRAGGARDLANEWRELVESAGSRFDAARWLLVDDTRGPVGVLLPQAVTHAIGTLFYVGVVPARRREGLGRMLHGVGLTLLAAQGLVRYVGSTDLRNAPMQRVFAANGCLVESTEVYLSS